MTGKKLTPSTPNQVETFLRNVATLPTVTSRPNAGRLIFALDATASREPTWKTAQRLQREMFDVAGTLGGLSLQLCYFRGLSDFHVSPWLRSAAELKSEMASVQCIGGYTQISRVLEHAQAEAKASKVSALVLIGDCMEEDVDLLCRQAGELALLGVRAFAFQEGTDRTAELAFRQIAQLTLGAYFRFDAGSAAHLRALLGAVAAYAAGGLSALDAYSLQRGGAVLQLMHQIKRT